MWTLLLGYSFSAVFEDSIIKLFKNNCYYRTLTYPGAGVGWFYQEHVKAEYDMTGAKKFTLEHEFRYRVLTQIVLICKYFCVYTHLISILELGTFSVLFGLYGSILIKHYLPQLKIVERISSNNYLKLILRETRLIKSEFIKMRHMTLNDKIFFSALLFLFRYGFLKTYFWLDFFVFFRLFFIISFIFTIVFTIFLPNYVVYSYLIENIPKNMTLLIKVLTKKLIFYFLLLSVFIALVVSDINIHNIINENFFKEIFFKILFFLVRIS